MTGDADILKTLAQTLDLAQTLKEHELCPDELRAILQKAATALSGSEEPAAGERLFTIYADGAARRNPGPAGAGYAGRLAGAAGPGFLSAGRRWRGCSKVKEMNSCGGGRGHREITRTTDGHRLMQIKKSNLN